MSPTFAPQDADAIPLDIVGADHLSDFLDDQSEHVRTWVAATGFKAGLGSVCLIPDDNGGIAQAIGGWGAAKDHKRGRLHLASIAQQLPDAAFALRTLPPDFDVPREALAWLMAHYAFDRYAAASGAKARLAAPAAVDPDRICAIAAGDALTRDLINTPASDMGPDALEAQFLALAKQHDAQTTVVKGADLLDQNFPMIHAVGRASDQAPRLLDMTWGDATHPRVTLVGKGVCFDTGGLNIKPAGSMGLMKKDMGGSATALGLAHMIMALDLPVRLRVLVPAVENSISAGAFRPQDILTSRKGLTVEINNTDAEGRLVLADALALADEESPDLLICQATLTGAARVALGPDVPPFYTDDDQLADALAGAAAAQADPLWRMPFWDPYEAMIEPGIADLDNAPKGGFGGSITAALFLRRFVENAKSFVHLDLYGWTPAALPGRSKGGACQSARALLAVIEERFA